MTATKRSSSSPIHLPLHKLLFPAGMPARSAYEFNSLRGCHTRIFSKKKGISKAEEVSAIYYFTISFRGRANFLLPYLLPLLCAVRVIHHYLSPQKPKRGNGIREEENTFSPSLKGLQLTSCHFLSEFLVRYKRWKLCSSYNNTLTGKV